MLGPIDYIAVGFEGNNFDGSILAELSQAVESGVIRLVDLLFVIKDADGNVAVAEVEDQYDELKNIVAKSGHTGDLPLITERDVEKLGASMDNDSSAGIMVIEHLWAKGLKGALIDAGGTLLAEGRIHPDLVAEAVDEIEHIKA